MVGVGATALWNRLSIGASGTILSSNGTDVAWNSTSALNLVTTDGSQTLTNKTISTGSNYQGNVITTTYGGSGLSSYTAGDLTYYSSGVTLSKLAIGGEGTVLSVSGGVPSWSATAPPAPHNLLNSTQHPDTTTGTVLRGDLIIGSGATASWSRLAVGTSGKYLGTNGTDPSWMTLDKTAVGLGSVENTALSTWAGSTSITTLGTIGTGTWNGSIIGVQYGGIGTSYLTPNGILYGNGTGAIGVSATGNTGQILIGVSSSAPTWLGTGTSGMDQCRFWNSS
jgi:hypothetical protein